jgi:hypothetical protein
MVPHGNILEVKFNGITFLPILSELKYVGTLFHLQVVEIPSGRYGEHS